MTWRARCSKSPHAVRCFVRRWMMVRPGKSNIPKTILTLSSSHTQVWTLKRWKIYFSHLQLAGWGNPRKNCIFEKGCWWVGEGNGSSQKVEAKCQAKSKTCLDHFGHVRDGSIWIHSDLCFSLCSKQRKKSSTIEPKSCFPLFHCSYDNQCPSPTIGDALTISKFEKDLANVRD